MNILVVGGTGTIGTAVVDALGSKHEVISVSRSSDIPVDLSDPASIAAMYGALPKLDAVVSTAGSGKFGPLDELADEDFAFGLGNKLMGQVNLVQMGRSHLNVGGSFTLTSGILASQPHAASVLITTLNAGVEGFVRAAALGMPSNQRLNAVSPPVVKETAQKLGWGDGGVPAVEVAKAYIAAVESSINGEVVNPLNI